MDIQKQNRPHLEPIQEESEQEDEIRGSETGEGQEEDFRFQEDVEAKEALTDGSEEDEDEDANLLRALRPRRLSRSVSGESISQLQSASNHQEEMENFSSSDWSSRAVDLSDEASLAGQPRLLCEKRSRSDELRINVSKIRWPKLKPSKLLVQKKTNNRRRKKASQFEEPFPKWLVDLMINIDEAVTHELVVE